ncbi:M23 family metallopeptidase [soil metagenome]
MDSIVDRGPETMKKVKYHYNKQTLRYERIKPSVGKSLLLGMGFLVTSALFGVGLAIVGFYYFDSPKEKLLKREIEKLELEYTFMDQRLSQMSEVLDGLQYRDENIYRVVFEAEPIPVSIREAGTGGSQKYKTLEGYDNSELMVNTSTLMDKLRKKMYIQSKSYDEVAELIKNKELMLASLPAIMPVANKDLTRVASGYGMRIHPVYKTYKMHTGMDFTAPIGTDIYATGNGTVVHVEYNNGGYGNHVVVDHGFGFQTLYGHMHKISVKRGQKILRGDVLGIVGNTGTSTGPHLHYEVIKNGVKINPVNYYFNDLSPEQFEQMIEISSNHNQSFD